MIIFYGLRTGQGSAGWFFCSVSCPWRSLGDTQLVDGLFWGPRRLCSQVWCLGRAGWKGGPPPQNGSLRVVISAQGSQSECSRENTEAGSLLGSSFGYPSMSFCHVPLANQVPRAGLDSGGGS